MMKFLPADKVSFNADEIKAPKRFIWGYVTPTVNGQFEIESNHGVLYIPAVTGWVYLSLRLKAIITRDEFNSNAVRPNARVL